MMPRRGAGMRTPLAPGAALAAAPVTATAAAMPVVAAKNWRRLRPSFVTSFSGLTSLSLCIVSAPSGSRQRLVRTRGAGRAGWNGLLSARATCCRGGWSGPGWRRHADSVDRGPGPLSLRARLDRRQDPLHLEPVGEGGPRVAALGDGGEEVDRLVGERVLVAEDVTGRPPSGDEGVRGLGDEHPGEACVSRVDGRVVDVEDVHVLEVERDRTASSVDLQSNGVLATRGEAGGLVGREGTTTHPRHEHCGVVHRDGTAGGGA